MWLIRMAFVFSFHSPQTCKDQQSPGFLQAVHGDLSVRKETWNQQATEEIVTVIKASPQKTSCCCLLWLEDFITYFQSTLYSPHIRLLQPNKEWYEISLKVGLCRIIGKKLQRCSTMMNYILYLFLYFNLKTRCCISLISSVSYVEQYSRDMLV